MEALRPLPERVRRTPDLHHHRPAHGEFRASGAGWFGAVVDIPGMVRVVGGCLVVAVPEPESLSGPRGDLRGALPLSLLLVAGSVPQVVAGSVVLVVLVVLVALLGSAPADRPRPRSPRPPRQRLPADNPWGFTMVDPALLADRGELHNLGIQRGTLTAAERSTINEHIIQAIRMLAALPFPDHLLAVPEIAGSHHERIDGRGYPRGLRGEQMGPLARMRAIADVFEALTAADRPCKSGNPLSVAVAIMAVMVRDGHLDGELFALFLRSGCHRRSAERFLAPEQSDAVAVEALLAAPDAPAGTP